MAATQTTMQVVTDTTQPQSVNTSRLLILAVWFVIILGVQWLAQTPDSFLAAFPEAWDLQLREPIDAFGKWLIANRTTHPLFLLVLDPFTDTVDYLLRAVENFLLATPWFVLVLALFFVAYRGAGLKVAGFTLFSLLFMGAIGLWAESMQTLALMGVSVLISLLIGIPLGIFMAYSERFSAIMRPLLDAMQTLPAFVYLLPVVLFFGVARVPSVVSTVIYALPPAIRMTSLGIRQVPHAATEAADAFGSTAWQKLLKVQIPLAMPTILVGINQTIMMALGMVVIAALIGAGGLGREVLLALQRLRVGQALEAGLAIVFVAVVLDRISYGFSEQRQQGESQVTSNARQSTRFKWLRTSWGYGGTILLLLVLLALLTPFFLASATFPETLQISIRQPIDEGVRWLRDNLYEIPLCTSCRLSNIVLGTGPFSDFLIIWLLNPLRALLQNQLSWMSVIVIGALIGYLSAGWRLAAASAVGILALGLLGFWHESMDTLSQVLVAVILAVLLGIPLGIGAARSDQLEMILRPILDFLQTIPVFVYLVPVIMLFNVGRVPGIIASVLYAIPPVIRLTSLGIRQVPQPIIEAADAFGATSLQKLRNVQIPLAMSSITLGINQTVMMVLAMVVIAGLVGGGALGFEAVNGLAKSELGRGIEAGLAIVILAVVMDRITQAWAGHQGT